MENFPQHCLDNAILLKQNDYIDLKMISSGFKTRFKLTQIPDFYTINSKEYFAVSNFSSNCTNSFNSYCVHYWYM